jgi:hypothetical protein
MKRLKVWKAPGPNCITKWILRYLPKLVISFLTEVFNAVLRRKYFPPAWKHARVVSTRKQREEPTLPSSCIHVSLFDTAGRFFVMTLLTARRFSWTVLLKGSTDVGQLTGAFFVVMAKEVDTIRIKVSSEDNRP